MKSLPPEVPRLSLQIEIMERDIIDNASNSLTGKSEFVFQLVRNPGLAHAEVYRSSSTKIMPHGDGAIGNRYAHASIMAQEIATHILRELVGRESFVEAPL